MTSKTHRYAGTDPDRPTRPHCSRCRDIGHAAAHPKLTCAEVGCDKPRCGHIAGQLGLDIGGAA